MLSIKFLDIGIPSLLSVTTNLIREEYIKLIILSAKSGLELENLFFITTTLSATFLLGHQPYSKHYQVLLS